ncbi:MAG TPA: hypothetical protein VIM80_06775 [Brevefilum sp.]
MTLLAFAALLLPGAAWWAWMGKRKQDPMVSLAQVIGVSLALIILIAEFLFLLGVNLTIATLLLILFIFLFLAILGFIKRGFLFQKKYLSHLIIGLVLFGLTLFLRFYQAQELLLPNWVDSQHHYLIIRVIHENGGLPETLSPYLEGPFYYHFGYHAVTALFTAISGMEIGNAMLLLGQVLNAVVSLSVYALGKTLWRDWRPAAVGGLLVSFVTRMPAYYLSWGRYTLLTGMILLPLAMCFAVTMLKKPRPWRYTFPLALLTSGLLLSHYFAASLLAIFLALVTIAHLFPRLNNWTKAAAALLPIFFAAVLGLLMAVPWFWRVLLFYPGQPKVSAALPESLDGLINMLGDGSYTWQLLGPTSNHWLLLVAGIGIILEVIHKKNFGFVLWSSLIALMSVPWGISFSPFRPDHFVIISFLPLVLWAGYLVWQAGLLLRKWSGKRWVEIAMISLFLVGWIAWSFPLSMNIVNPVTVMVTEDDIAALNWIRENTPEDARFFINTTHWQNGVYRGVDGGGWILPYTGRWSLVPTVFYGFSPDKEQYLQLRDWGEAASEMTGCSDEFRRIVGEADLDYVYIREGIGGLWTEGLAGCEGLERVYGNESVWIGRLVD